MFVNDLFGKQINESTNELMDRFDAHHNDNTANIAKIKQDIGGDGEMEEGANDSMPKEVNMDRWMKAFEKREDNNFHTENVVAVAKLVGDEKDIQLAKEIYKDHMKLGHMPADLYSLREALFKKLWPLVLQKYNAGRAGTDLDEAVDSTELQKQINQLDDLLDDVKRLKQQSQEITSEIKYDNAAGDILARVDQLVQHIAPYVDKSDYKDLVDAVQEAQDQLRSAVFGLDQIFDYAAYKVQNKMEEIRDMIDYPDDEEEMKEGLRGGTIRSGSISEEGVEESLRPGEHHHYEDDPKTGKRVYKGIRGEQHSSPSKHSSRDLDSNERADRERKAHVSHDRKMTEQGYRRTPEQERYGDLYGDLRQLANSGKVDTPEGRRMAEQIIDEIQELVDTVLPGNPVPSKKVWLSDWEPGVEQGVSENMRDPWKDKYFGPTEVIKKIFSVKTNDNKKYRVRAETEQEAKNIMQKHAPDSEVVSIKFIKNIMSEQGVTEAYKSQIPSKEEAIAFAKDKVQTFRDPLDGIEIWAMPDGGCDVVHTMNSNGRDHTIRNGGKKLGTIYPSKDVMEGERRMSRAAKGNEKYGKDGMKALAKAGREGASEKKLDAIRDKHDNYNESVAEAKSPAQQAAIAINMKKAGKKPKSNMAESIDHYLAEMEKAGYEFDEAEKCSECGGPSYSDKMIAEEKDACYHKVKARYKIWPSAYASGALVKCRKSGAKNWGNKSKK